jgi:hypothetical protein
MAMFKSFMTLLIATTAMSTTVAQKAPYREQDRVRNDTNAGAVLPLRSIEDRIVPGMKARGASYIGTEYDGQISRYRLKFMRGKSVIWVDVDGRSGTIIGKAGE